MLHKSKPAAAPTALGPYSFVSDIIAEAKAAPRFAGRIPGLEALDSLCSKRNIVFAAQLIALDSTAFSENAKAYGVFRPVTEDIRNRLPSRERVTLNKEVMGAEYRTSRVTHARVWVYPKNPVEAISNIREAYRQKGIGCPWPKGLMSQTVDRRWPASRYFEGTISREFYKQNVAVFEKMGLGKDRKIDLRDVLAASSEVRYELALVFREAVEDVLHLGLQPDKAEVVSNPAGVSPLLLRPSRIGLEYINDNFPGENADRIQARVVEIISDPEWGQKLLTILSNGCIERYCTAPAP